jgi:mRNA interferase HigB
VGGRTTNKRRALALVANKNLLDGPGRVSTICAQDRKKFSRLRVRIITKKPLEEFWLNYPATEKELSVWYKIVAGAAWKTPADVKAAFGQRVDFVRTRNGNTLAVFDVSNNRCRLIAAIHYLSNYPAKGRVYVLRVLTHKEYDLQDWKYEL